MIKESKEEFLKIFSNALTPPYSGSMRQWCEEFINLPSTGYSIPGKLNLGLSPYLLPILKDIEDPRIKTVTICTATQIGKSLVAEIAIPYLAINNPGPLMRILNNNDSSNRFAETRVIPLLQNCEPIKPLLKYKKFSTKLSGITLPHMSIIMRGANEGVAHGLSVRYLLADEVHDWDIGMLDKFTARTTAFAGRRKIIISSQPNETGSELEKVFLSGKIYEWHWCCPNCKTYQPFTWAKRRSDDSFSGFNWDTILNDDGETTNIALSAKTTWLECCNDTCRHKVTDTPSNRRGLNNEGKYICIKDDGASDVVSYTCPNFVNINLTFESAASQYMIAKRWQRQSGLDEQMKIFVNQVLGKFYKAEPMLDMTRIMVEPYDVNDTDNKDWVRTMGVDVQRKGGVKYYVVWAWHKNGNESRRVDFGIARTWEEIEAIRVKNKVLIPCVGVDSGDGESMLEVYQECIKHGMALKQNGIINWISWQPMKGDQKISFKHKDGITRLYAEVSPQDAGFPSSSKYCGIPAPLRWWATTSVKVILTNLRDGLIPGVKWVVDKADNDFDTQLYSEALKTVVDKRTGASVQRWVEIGHDNHYLDCCAMSLTLAMQAGVFSATKVNEDEIRKAIESQQKKPI